MVKYIILFVWHNSHSEEREGSLHYCAKHLLPTSVTSPIRLFPLPAVFSGGTCFILSGLQQCHSAWQTALTKPLSRRALGF